ncbi:acylphosphatase [Rothia sp. P5764]|uniref:acylphosphatase n=1 Tax=Rothia sp. P5764 TaxID=3402654 RepID=UPI003AD7CCA2
MGFFDIFSSKDPAGPIEVQLMATVYGKVQGVGFRWWTAGIAKPLGLVGYAKNLDDGSVEIVAQGSRTAVEGLLAELKSGDTAGRVDHLDADITQPVGSYDNFGIY